ncbi:MAG TPA: hypothetical protein VLH60_06730 [Sedimentisphaerales bacterium]|nr:hypothetical protein [Sedimentisphaerales bacterium]
MFRFYSMGGTVAGKWLLLFGLGLIGLGVLVFIFRQILAALAALILILTGAGFCVTALRILWVARRTRRGPDDGSQGYRENVRIRGNQGNGAW